jgi:hypothetical protein
MSGFPNDPCAAVEKRQGGMAQGKNAAKTAVFIVMILSKVKSKGERAPSSPPSQYFGGIKQTTSSSLSRALPL